MGFERNFRALEEIPAAAEGLDHAVLGREIATNRPVMIHFPAEQPGQSHNSILRQVLSLGPEYSHYVLEAGSSGGRSYIVTRLLPENASLRQWIGIAAAASTDSSQPERPESRRPKEPGEFTRVFVDPSAVNPVEPVRNEEAGEFTRTFLSSGSTTDAMPVRSEGPGEFTQLFGPSASARNVALTQPPTASALPQTVTTPVRSGEQPGEFTKVFGPADSGHNAEGTKSAPLQATTVPPAAQPGEFTQQFGMPPVPNRQAAAASAGSPPIQNFSPSNESAGEFTRQFGMPVSERPEPQYSRPAMDPFPTGPAPQTLSDADHRAPGVYTQMLRTPVPSPNTRVSDSGSTGVFSQRQASAPAAPSAPLEPGLYTREFAKPVLDAPKEPAPAQPPPSAKPAPPKSTSAYLPVILVVAGCLAIALLVIIFLAVRG